MSATTQVTTFSDLYTDLMNRVRSQTTETATVSQAKRYIAIALQDMHIGFQEKVPWAERSAQLLTHASYSTGTVAITQGSTTLTGTGTAWNTANAFSVNNAQAGGKIVIAGLPVIYEVSAVGGDTAITLTQKFVGETQTEATYVYFEDEYALAADFLRPVDAQSFDDRGTIDLISRTEFRQRYPRNAVTGNPRAACIVDRAASGSTTPRRRIALAPPPSTTTLIPYSYITSNLVVSSAGAAQAEFSADSDEPIVPLRYRHAIVFHALAKWYRDKKDDGRADSAQGDYTDLMLRIGADQEIGAKRPRLAPRVSHYRARAARPWRGAGRFDTGGRFDRMED